MRGNLIAALMILLLASCTGRTVREIENAVRYGQELQERKLFSEAMEVYSDAEAKALKEEDQYILGTIYRQMALIYNATGNNADEITYLDKAIEAFEAAGKPYNTLHVYFESGIARYNIQDYASAEKMFRNTIFQAHQAADTLLEAAGLEAYAALCLEKAEQDPVLAINMLARTANELRCPLTSENRGRLAYAYALTGDHDAASEWVVKALQTAETPSEAAQARFREYQVESRAGNTAKALEALEAVMEHSNSVTIESLKRSVSAAREESREQQHELTRHKLKTTRMMIFLIALACLAVIFAMVSYIRYQKLETAKKLAEEKAETERFMTIAEELQTRLKAASKRLPSEKHMAIARFDLLERLCEQYYVYEGTDNLQGKILKEVKSVIEGLREDPKAIKGLEMMLDRNCDNLIARLREQMPKLKPDDIRLFIFAACGFSSTTISTILEKDKGIVYNRIWRLKGKISASEAADKEDFLASINN